MTTSSENRAFGRAVVRVQEKLLRQVVQKNRCSGTRVPFRPMGAEEVLPLRLVPRLPQWEQRTRRSFCHPRPSLSGGLPDSYHETDR